MTFDLVISGGTVATAADVVRADVGIVGGRVVAIAERLRGGTRTVDAGGRLVLPGGIDAHCHLDQPQAPGLASKGAAMADGFRSGSISAAFGGTTTIVPFCVQHRGGSVTAAVADYHRRAEGEAVIDYAFHLIVSDPTPAVLGQELPALIRRGHASLKVYMTYEALHLSDRQILDVLATAREERAIVLVHAENHEVLTWLAERLEASGRTAPKEHAASRPLPVEREATHRAVTLAEVVGVPLVVVHISGGEPLEEVRRARARGLTVIAETCPQYLMLTAADLDLPDMEGAKAMCSPPPRDTAAQAALWRGIEDGTVDIVNSDHAPYRFDAGGKLRGGPGTSFRGIANGLPGLETRLPILFSEGVVKGRIDLQRFVALTATNNAKFYGLHPRKGTIAVGADADVAIWDPEKRVTIRNADLHHAVDYTPFEGLEIQGWPETVLSRGEVVVEAGALKAQPGRGRFLEQRTSSAYRPQGGASSWT
ncbi:dihydropyrimidinase [Lichenibacterium minor]|uniref:Dihydropyrimidinase n=1 Tax=Lichenibacterium minor TaxID=2316528 RepID=A0A4Q2U374_9HYPH|nr:dihydropyrimidinase [Lichenibacterium minor]RYC30640.1 dihydropyrimidinase [Lichenibacterium minor]